MTNQGFEDGFYELLEEVNFPLCKEAARELSTYEPKPLFPKNPWLEMGMRALQTFGPQYFSQLADAGDRLLAPAPRIRYPGMGYPRG